MNAGSIIATLRLRTEEFRRGINDARNQLKRVSSDFKEVGAGAIAFGGAMAAGLGVAVKTAANFEQAMSKVGAVSGATDEEMQDLTATAKELGASTSFSASQAAEGMQYLAMAGFETNDIISAMPGVLNMAAAGAVSLGDAANIASNIMSGFGIEAAKAGQVSDVLAKTFTSSNTTLQGLGETMKYVAPAASSVGWSLESMAAAAGKLGDAGIDASMAGTALRSAVTRLAAPTKEAASLMEQYNIQLFDANGKMLPLADILGQMQKEFTGLSDAERAAAVQTIFGTEAMSAMLELMKDPQELKNFTQELENAGGTAENIADKQLDNLNGALTKLGSATEAAQISIGEALVPAIRTLAELITQAVTWFNNLDESTKRFIAISAAVTAGLTLFGGGLMLVIGFLPNIINGFGSVTTVAKTLGTALRFLATNPVGIIITAIGALIAIFIKLYNTNEEFRQNVQTVWNAIVGFLKPVLNLIKTIVAETFESVKQVIQSALAIIENILMAFANLFTGNWSGLWENVKAILSNALNLLWNLFQLWGTGKILKFAGVLFGRLGGVFRNGLTKVLGIARNLLNRIFGVFRNIGNNMRNTISGAISSVIGRFSGLYYSVVGKLSILVSSIRSKVRQAKRWLSELNPFKRHSPSLVDNVKAGVEAIRETYANLSNMEIKPPKVGMVTAGRVNIDGIVQGGSGGNNYESNYNAPLVNVERMDVRDENDVRQISSELYNLQRNADRKRGR